MSGAAAAPTAHAAAAHAGALQRRQRSVGEMHGSKLPPCAPCSSVVPCPPPCGAGPIQPWHAVTPSQATRCMCHALSRLRLATSRHGHL